MATFTEHKLDITADDRIFTPRGVGALNIGIVQCLSELIANSLDWRRFSADELERIKNELDENGAGEDHPFVKAYGPLLDAEPVNTEIRIQYDGDSIEIFDNGIGMTLEELQVGLKLRAASDAKREPLRSRKGMFGMGMKIGILGVGWKFEIRSRSYFEEVENAIEIDTREIEEGKLELRSIPGRVYKEHDTHGPLGGLESGTYIKIEDLHKTRHKPDLWWEELGRNFAPEIEFEKIKIVVVDKSGDSMEMEPCKPEVIDIIPDTKVDLDQLNIEIMQDFGDGTRGEPTKVRGWLALRTQSASGSGRWGIHTFRKGQLVEPFHNDGPKDNGLLPKEPHPTFARLHGVLHLDMCDPNFTKVGWNTELESWNEVREALAPHISNLMNASREYRVRSGGGAKSRKLIQKAKEMAKTAVGKLSEDDEDQEEIPEESRHLIAIGEGEYLKISTSQQAHPNPDLFWEYSYNKPSKEIAVFVNTESNLWEWAENSRDSKSVASLIVNWAIVDSLYFCMVVDMEIERARAIELRDRWHAKLYEGEADE